MNSRTGVKSSFRFRIAPKFSQYLRHFDFTGALLIEPELLSELLILVSSLPNIETLKLDPWTLAKLYPSYTCEDDSEFPAALRHLSDISIALRSLLQRVKGLELQSISRCHRWSQLLSLANPQLSSLSLHHLTCGPEEDINDVIAIMRINLQRFTALQELSVRRTPTFTNLIGTWKITWWSLRRLRFELDTLTVFHVDLISSLASTLESLELETDDDVESSTTGPFLSDAMPHLVSLSVVDTSESFQATPAIFTPSLRHLTLRSTSPHTSHIATFLSKHLEQLPCLQSIDFAPRPITCPSLSYEETVKLANASRDRCIDRSRQTFNPFHLTGDLSELVERVSESATDQGYLERRDGPIQEVLSFAARYKAVVLGTRDKVGMDRLVEAVRPLKLLQELQED